MYWLIGMMGSGKTTAGLAAAEKLGIPFQDTDDLIERQSGLSIAQIWEMGGEVGFRELERVAVSSLEDAAVVVATGGGTPMDQANREVIARGDSVVWLDCAVEVLVERTSENRETRPLLGGENLATLENLIAQRTPIYRELATLRIDTSGMSVEEVARELVELWNTSS